MVWLDRLSRRLARAEQGARVRVSRDLVRAIQERSRQIADIQAPQRLELPGCGALSAAKLLAETAGVARAATDSKLTRLAGVAPIPASSGRRTRHRLDRGGNRQICAAPRRGDPGARAPCSAGVPSPKAGWKVRLESKRCAA